MAQEVSSIRLLALAYAKGRLTRSEYLHKRGQQLSAIEFGQTQPPVDETNTLVRTIGEEVAFLKDARVSYIQGGAGDALAAARLRRSDDEGTLSDSERLEYRSANKLLMLAGTIIVLGVLLQLAGLWFQKTQREAEAGRFDKLFNSDPVDLTKELNLNIAVEEQRRTPAEYDSLAKAIVVGQALERIPSTDLNALSSNDINEILAMISACTEQEHKILVSTTWFEDVVDVLGYYSDDLDLSLSSGANSKATGKALKTMTDRRNAFLQLYSDLADLMIEFEETEQDSSEGRGAQ
ncbi:MAG: hypothetical protein K8963_07870 [Proteobacteria bacterium]|nr:hypothetical protein [Pseudomonadota bacterium]